MKNDTVEVSLTKNQTTTTREGMKIALLHIYQWSFHDFNHDHDDLLTAWI